MFPRRLEASLKRSARSRAVPLAMSSTVDLRGETLLTANAAHYRMIPGLALTRFRPES